MSEPVVPTITCSCGRTLRLAGATPGRVGRCPECGRSFRVPEAPSVVPESEDELEPMAGYALAPAPASEPGLPPLIGGDLSSPRRRLRYTDSPDEPPRRRRPRPDRTPIEAIGRGGIFPLPKRPEETLLGSLLYPLWDDLGLMALAILPLVLGVTSIIALGVIPWALREGGAMLLVVPITIGFVVAFAFAMAYTLALGGAVLVGSALGDLHHPRWPDLEIGVLLGAILRWSLAWGVGLGLAYLPVSWLLPLGGEISLPGRVIRGVLVSVGGIYALVALLAVYLHDDASAVGPNRVLPAIAAIGPRFSGIWALLAAASAIGIVAVEGIHRALQLGIPAMLAAAWATWVFAIYAGLVILRATGRAYDRRAKQVGWFEKRRLRVENSRDPVAAPPEPPPEI